MARRAPPAAISVTDKTFSSVSLLSFLIALIAFGVGLASLAGLPWSLSDDAAFPDARLTLWSACSVTPLADRCDSLEDSAALTTRQLSDVRAVRALVIICTCLSAVTVFCTGLLAAGSVLSRKFCLLPMVLSLLECIMLLISTILYAVAINESGITAYMDPGAGVVAHHVGLKPGR